MTAKRALPAPSLHLVRIPFSFPAPIEGRERRKCQNPAQRWWCLTGALNNRSSLPRTQRHRCYNSADLGLRVAVCEVENADQRPMERGMNLAALITGMQHDLGRGRSRRSEERRVGKECVLTFRARGSPYH